MYIPLHPNALGYFASDEVYDMTNRPVLIKKLEQGFVRARLKLPCSQKGRNR